VLKESLKILIVMKAAVGLEGFGLFYQMNLLMEGENGNGESCWH
jgi:hypothetical protein